MPITETPPDSSTPPPAREEQPARISAGRYGELDHHELVRLLDTIEDERARGRFRESLYISMFVWIIVVWVLFYGPRYLWHAPQVKDPFSAIKEHELTQLQLPIQPKLAPTPASKPAPRPTVDNKTLERLKAMEPKIQPTPQPPAPAPAQTPPMTATNNPPNLPTPAPTPTPRPAAPLADAPSALRPNFNNSTSASNSIQNAINGAARDHSGGVGNIPGNRPGRGPLNLGGYEILSDTQGVDFTAYLRRLLGDVKRNWDPLIPPEAGPPLYKQGETWIRFSINPDGSIRDMHLDGSTHDEAINKSCWGSIISEGQFPPLPTQFHGPYFELRLHYLVNKGWTTE